MELNTIQELVDDLRQGKMVILMDDEDRENEGDIIMAASMVRPEDINFMAKYARGLICLTLTRERCEQLELPLMVTNNGAAHGTNFTVSIEAAEGVTTGISAADRAHTVQVAVKRDAVPSDIVQPGHIFPLMAQPGGVLRRAGHTEAGCDLTRLAGFEPAAVIVEVMNEDGTMARRPDLEKFAQQHGIKIGTIADLIHYRTVNERTVEQVRKEVLPTRFGNFDLHVFNDLIEGQTHLALVRGNLQECDAPYVRVHVADPLRDLIGAIKDDASGWSLEKAMRFMNQTDQPGVFLLLGDSFRQHDVEDLLDSYFSGLQGPRRKASAKSSGMYRTIGTGAQILRQLGVTRMRLLSSPLRFFAISGFNLEIVEYINSSSFE
ncbi:Riboflavin biosynthesis bifunctional protein : GTP cyclohydrolase ii and 3,4-dihydroxy-2-butanone-4-phosphate synthase [gamma proteobacterium HdN1]|nr:Riboflavin biosynthesis bifunctional protein : GTP cyclohydrolase ii and 3,4-dihydroxy-2-butanone-4-phosphate synthase [gamma proteobacterium HdN1]